jgi:L-lactate dehydrogenase complex protein LldG
MDPKSQASFMARIRAALGRSDPFGAGSGLDALIQTRPTPSDEAVLERIGSRKQRDWLSLLERLRQAAQPINIQLGVHENPAAVRQAILHLARERHPEWAPEKSVVAWDHPLIEELGLAKGLKEHAIPLHLAPKPSVGATSLTPDERISFRERARWAFIGITAADFCLADTATLVMKTRPGQPRSVSLLPSIHVAVVRLVQILCDLKELHTLLKFDPRQSAEGLTNCTTYITGPSKTADIEANLVHGAHGPRELHIMVSVHP